MSSNLVVVIYEMHTRLAREEPSDRVSHHD